MDSQRIRQPALAGKVMSAAEAATFFHNGMTIGLSGFTRAGDAKAMPRALADRAAHEELHFTVITGASLGNGSDGLMAEAGLLARRIVFNPKAGDRLERGQRVGMIKFGSRVDVVLDASARVNVKIGDHVKGGSTILAYLQPRETASAGSVSAIQKAH